MIDFSQTRLEKIITHYVGNKLRDERYTISEEETQIDDDSLNFFLKYLFTPFKSEGLFHFTHAVELSLNEVNVIIGSIFDDPNNFIPRSKDLAYLLYESSLHPKIKGGELNIVYLKNVILDEEILDAIGILKSEEKDVFLKINSLGDAFSIEHEAGISINKMDKGCIIFNTEKSSGFKISTIEGPNKSSETQYWRDDFLHIQEYSDSFNQTNNYLNLTKKFITKQLNTESEITKADRMDLLNRSVEYFKKNNDFDETTFTKEIFGSENLIKSFKQYKDSYQENNPNELQNEFAISSQAVKGQVRNFKSVIKLDKNFHLYIHGDKQLIEKGYDEIMRKSFYKIYFDNEV